MADEVTAAGVEGTESLVAISNAGIALEAMIAAFHTMIIIAPARDPARDLAAVRDPVPRPAAAAPVREERLRSSA